MLYLRMFTEIEDTRVQVLALKRIGVTDKEIHSILFLAAYLIIGGDIMIRAVKNIIRGQVFDEHFLMALATIGAFLIQQYPEASPLCCFIKSVSFFKVPRSAVPENQLVR